MVHRRCYFIVGFLLAASLSFAQASNPFQPPNATVHYAPDRDYDLTNITVTIDVDYPNRKFTGIAVNTLAPLRDGLDHITLNAGQNLQITTVTIDGRPATYARHDNVLVINSGPVARGKAVVASVSYTSEKAAGRGFGQGGAGGWHWIQETAGTPNHIGFWTQGESGYNSNWAPTWDYPNDFTTSETRTTVPADWVVVGNGVPVSNTLNSGGKTRTYVWRMTLPHATYLLSLVGGPFDVGHDNWRGVPLWYVVPKGKGNLIPGSFGDTPDMLSFYSDTLGFKYSWPKYA